ncbi:hypothetical protein [Micromonospora aurantiaca (nom. illeg.)]|uniref:hypothetical protein n=1 Tax=Micromonospora aurantiaca (nom. illeg.) TaxID=47850 RepID=UPI0033C7D62D
MPWLNWIEAESAAVRYWYFALNGTDHRNHTEQDAAIGDYIRWRNQRGQTEIRIRDQPQDPPPGLPVQGCMTGYYRLRHSGCRLPDSMFTTR